MVRKTSRYVAYSYVGKNKNKYCGKNEEQPDKEQIEMRYNKGLI